MRGSGVRISSPAPIPYAPSCTGRFLFGDLRWRAGSATHPLTFSSQTNVLRGAGLVVLPRVIVVMLAFLAVDKGLPCLDEAAVIRVRFRRDSVTPGILVHMGGNPAREEQLNNSSLVSPEYPVEAQAMLTSCA